MTEKQSEFDLSYVNIRAKIISLDFKVLDNLTKLMTLLAVKQVLNCSQNEDAEMHEHQI